MAKQTLLVYSELVCETQ